MSHNGKEYTCVCVSVFPNGLADKESTCNAGEAGSILGSEDPLEDGMATQSILARKILWAEGTWWAMVYEVAKSQTRLKQLSTRAHTHT